MRGCENWAINRSDKRKTASAEMRFLRRQQQEPSEKCEHIREKLRVNNWKNMGS
jgi:hypothetical protein